MTEQILTPITADELIRRAHEAAAADDAQKEREAQEFLAEQAHKAALKRQEQADELRALIHRVCGFEIDLTPADLDENGAWSIHPQVNLFVERWMGHPQPILKLTARRPGAAKEAVTTLVDLSRFIQAAETYEAKLTAEREAKRREREEADRCQAERDTLRAELAQQRTALENEKPHAPELEIYVSSLESSDGLLLVSAGPVLDVYPLRFGAPHPLYLLELHQATVERLLNALEFDGPGIVTAGQQTVLVLEDEDDPDDVTVTWIKETDNGHARAGWVVHQRWDSEDFAPGLRSWLAFRQAVLAWEAKLRLIDDKLYALRGSDF